MVTRTFVYRKKSANSIAVKIALYPEMVSKQNHCEDQPITARLEHSFTSSSDYPIHVRKEHLL